MPTISRILRQKVLTVFLFFQCFFLAGIVWVHFLGPAFLGAGIKYSAIVLCLGFSIFYANLGGDRLLPLAMFFTLLADAFLVLLDRNIIIGVLFFYAVQMVYLVRMAKINGGRAWLFPRLLLFTLGLIFLAKIGGLTGASGAVCLYITHFFINILMSLSLTGQQGRLFCAGLILFFCCDICVGLSNISGLFSKGLESFLTLAVWIFYLPGQTLLVLSGQYPLDVVRKDQKGEHFR